MAELSNSRKNYYDDLKNQEYTNLFNKEIALENAKQNALKYTNNQMANQGFASQGYGSSQASGITNMYQNALASAKQSYNDNMNTINQNQQSEQDSLEESAATNVASMIANTQDTKTLSDTLASLGYGSYDNDGNFNLGKKPNDMNDIYWANIQNAYNDRIASETPTYNQGDEIIPNLGSTNNVMLDKSIFESYLKDKNFTLEDGATQVKASNFEKGLKTTVDNISNGKYKQGDAIALQDKKGNTIYVVYTGTGLAQVNKATYDNATNKYLNIKGTESKVL